MAKKIGHQIICKVEFIQPSCWLYSVPNLLVFQYLVVFRWDCCKGSEWDRVMKCSRVCKKQRLATGSRGWLAAASRQKQHTCQACQKLKRYATWSITGQNRTTGRSIISRLDLVTQSSYETKPQASPILKSWLFTFHSHPSINTPYTHKRKRAFRENFERKTLE